MAEAVQDRWDAVWASPGEWWDDLVEMAGEEAGQDGRTPLQRVHDQVVACGCQPVDLYTALRRLQKTIPVSSKVWGKWHDQFMAASELLWAVRAALPNGLTDDEFHQLRHGLGHVAALCQEGEIRTAGQKKGGKSLALDTCLDAILERTGRHFPAKAIAVLISHTTRTQHTASSLKMLRSRKGKKVMTPERLR